MLSTGRLFWTLFIHSIQLAWLVCRLLSRSQYFAACVSVYGVRALIYLLYTFFRSIFVVFVSFNFLKFICLIVITIVRAMCGLFFSLCRLYYIHVYNVYIRG